MPSDVAYSELTSKSAIREFDAKLVLAHWLPRSPSLSGGKPESDLATPFSYPTVEVAQIAWDEATNTITPDSQLPQWVFSSKLVAKPDQLIKRRGKAGLLALNKSWPEAKQWIAERAGKPVKVRFNCVMHRPLRVVLVPPFSFLALSSLAIFNKILAGCLLRVAPKAL